LPPGDQLDARRGAPVRTRRRPGRGRRRYNKRYRPIAPWIPREANAVVEVGGVRTLFRMPDLLSIGPGGGSHIDPASARVGRSASATV
jgi:hypothetical protein